MTKTRYLPALTFFCLAFALTYVFNRFVPELKISKLDVKTVITGLGPLLSGVFCYSIFKTENTCRISVSGVRPVITYGVVCLSLLLPLMFLTQVPKQIIVLSFLTQGLYSLGEEAGWRHYLQNLTVGMNGWGQAFFIGTLWFFWHFSFGGDPVKLMTGQDVPAVIGFPVMILVLSLFSFLWGDLTVKTRSILLPTVAHALPKYGDKISVLVIVTILLLLQLLWNGKGLGRAKAA